MTCLQMLHFVLSVQTRRTNQVLSVFVALHKNAQRCRTCSRQDSRHNSRVSTERICDVVLTWPAKPLVSEHLQILTPSALSPRQHILSLQKLRGLWLVETVNISALRTRGELQTLILPSMTKSRRSSISFSVHLASPNSRSL